MAWTRLTDSQRRNLPTPRPSWQSEELHVTHNAEAMRVMEQIAECIRLANPAAMAVMESREGE